MSATTSTTIAEAGCLKKKLEWLQMLKLGVPSSTSAGQGTNKVSELLALNLERVLFILFSRLCNASNPRRVFNFSMSNGMSLHAVFAILAS